jgi:hypothetical protein
MKERWIHGSVLREVQRKKGNERPKERDNEERQTGYSRHLPDLRHQDVQNREKQVI